MRDLLYKTYGITFTDNGAMKLKITSETYDFLKYFSAKFIKE